MFSFAVSAKDGRARRGQFNTPHGAVQTPAFMPVGTAGTVKGVHSEQLAETGAGMILANTYHLLLRPGPETVARLGGLHAMMGWDGPILTDSGGYQVFSLAHMRKIDDRAVVFRSHVDGSEVVLSPARAVEVQWMLGADVMMQLDECPPVEADHAHVAEAVRRSADWAARCRTAWVATGCGALRHLADEADAAERPLRRLADLPAPDPAAERRQALFGIQQGGVFDDLRAESAARLAELDLPGYAVGGLSVGEGHEAMMGVLDDLDDQLPHPKPRYLMGVGEPRDILGAVARGVDLFDCVLPTRNGRNAQAFTWAGRLRLRNSRFTADGRPIDPACGCAACRRYSRGTIRHLFMAREMLGPILVSLHNLHFFAELMAAIRSAIEEGTFDRQRAEWLERMQSQP